MSGIFISYRREDAAGHAGRLFDRLAQHFGRDQVFMDVAGIDPGVDFVEAIEQAVGSCGVLIVVIGKQWAQATDAAGRCRLEDSNDFVRLETATALKRNVRVIVEIAVGVQRAPLQATVPNLVGLSMQAALTALEKAGLKLGRRSGAASAREPGIILRQSISSGTLVAPGSAVDLVYATRQTSQPATPRGLPAY